MNNIFLHKLLCLPLLLLPTLVTASAASDASYTTIIQAIKDASQDNDSYLPDINSMFVTPVAGSASMVPTADTSFLQSGFANSASMGAANDPLENDEIEAVVVEDYTAFEQDSAAQSTDYTDQFNHSKL